MQLAATNLKIVTRSSKMRLKKAIVKVRARRQVRLAGKKRDYEIHALTAICDLTVFYTRVQPMRFRWLAYLNTRLERPIILRPNSLTFASMCFSHLS